MFIRQLNIHTKHHFTFYFLTDAECPPGMEWNDCGPSCQLTCASASADTVEECSGKCVPGCFCPPGTVLNHETCIPPEQCGDRKYNIFSS